MVNKIIPAAAVILLVYVAYALTSPAPVVCTEDALVCWDGSTASRVSPSCEFSPCLQDPVKGIDLKSERNLYHSQEIMWLNLTVESETGGLAQVWAHGIEARLTERLRIRQNQTLKPGINEIMLKYPTPSCTGCAGIKPGNYTVTAEVTVGARTQSKNITVDIQQ